MVGRVVGREGILINNVFLFDKFSLTSTIFINIAIGVCSLYCSVIQLCLTKCPQCYDSGERSRATQVINIFKKRRRALSQH